MRSRRRLLWRDGLYAGSSNQFLIALAPAGTAGLSDYHARIGLYGDTFYEQDMIDNDGISSSIANAIDEGISRYKGVIRIVGEISYRGYGPPGTQPGQPGSNPIYVVRSGLIVLPTDSNGQVLPVSLDASSQGDVETNWLFLEQFPVVGADVYPQSAGTASPSTDGLNHLVVNRRYDIRVKRQIAPKELLVWCFLLRYMDFIPNPVPPVFVGMGVRPAIRLLTY